MQHSMAVPVIVIHDSDDDDDPRNANADAGCPTITYISFDIGINNMAYCEAKYAPGTGQKMRVSRWCRERLSAFTVADTKLTIALEGLNVFLKEHFPPNAYGCTNTQSIKVVIERQVKQNYKATALSHVIIGYFLGLGIKLADIRLWDPKRKALPIEATVGTKRKRTLLIEPTVRALLEKWVNNATWCIDIYNAASKKDDLFDAFLQLMAVLDFDIQMKRGKSK